jgi:NhaA family Na+:H+ antiporter
MSEDKLGSLLRRWLESEAAGGLLLMGSAVLAMVIANSPLSRGYFALLHAPLGGLDLLHWINDGLMALFFLLVGLEIKREAIEGELSTWSARALPTIGAVGGMAVPALIYVALQGGDAKTLHGWAIPAATDIAFALGVMSLLGKRVPPSLKLFLTALAIIDDLGAILIIAIFYTSELSLPALAGAAGSLAVLIALNRFKVMRLWPYLVVGAALWAFTLGSGVHPTLAGVALALTIPLGARKGAPCPLHRLEHALQGPVAYVIVPLFGLANAGVSLAGLGLAALAGPITLGVASGLVLGKAVGVFGSAWLAIRFGFARMPALASRRQLFGAAVLCGIGFTMSLFIGGLAFDEPGLQDASKLGVLVGSVLSALAGWALLRAAPEPKA